MSTRPDDAAFTTPTTIDGNGNVHYGNEGLTKREYFAALALQAFISLSPDAATVNMAPAAAVLIADQLIAELNKPANT